jgi:hypothetical protein
MTAAPICARCGCPVSNDRCIGCGRHLSSSPPRATSLALPSRDGASAATSELASESPEAPAPAWGAPDPGEADVAAEVTASVSAGLALGRSGLPASKIPGLEDEIRVLTLDDVAMPLVDAASAAAIVEAIEERSTATLPPPPPRGHPALGVGPGWSDRIAALEVRVARIDSEQAQQRNSIAAIETVGLHELAQRIARLEHPEPVGPAEKYQRLDGALRERAAIVAWLKAMPIASFESAAEADRMCNITAAIEAGEHLPKGA